MSSQWRLFLAALRYVTHRSDCPGDAVDDFPPRAATRFLPLVGIVVGLFGGGVYWLAAQLWPTNVAVVVSMLATVLVTPDARGGRFGVLYWVFVVFVKYNALMALSAASVPFALPSYLTLGLIMIAGQAASRALVVSVMATDAPAALRATNADLCLAVIIGLAPATLLGIPGLIGLGAAIVMRLCAGTSILPGLAAGYAERLENTQQLTEACFYLGALAAWKYI